ARAQAETSRRRLYAAQVNVAQQALESRNIAQARQLLAAQRPGPGQQDLRGYEWRYLSGLSGGNALATLTGHTDAIQTITASPDGRLLATCSEDGTARLWDLATCQPAGVL